MNTRPILARIVVVLWYTTALLSGVVNAATIKSGITLISDNEAIYLGDSVILEVEAVGLVDPLDVSSLFKDADLLRETTGTRIAVINERVVEVKLRRMEFVPRREGRAFFGPLTGVTSKGDVKSNAIIINVLPPADTNWQPDDDDLQVHMQLRLAGSDFSDTQTSNDAIAPYVGQHIIADIVLKHRHPIAEEKLTLPSFHGFDVLSEFEERRTIDRQDPTDSWRVIAWRYHLFAQHSGMASISGLQWQGSAVRSRTQRATFERTLPRQKFNVLKAATESDWWLPATNVSLTDQWSKDPRELSAGDEIIRTITLTADGVLASHLPEVVPLESRALSSTLIRHTREQQLTGSFPQSSASFEFRMVAQSPIPVFLDTVRVAWFDTGTGVHQEAIIPARRINVGLPDRADLLAEIALNNHWWDRLTLKLQTIQSRFHYWNITLGLLSIVACALWIREWRERVRLRHSTVKDINRGVLPPL